MGGEEKNIIKQTNRDSDFSYIKFNFDKTYCPSMIRAQSSTSLKNFQNFKSIIIFLLVDFLPYKFNFLIFTVSGMNKLFVLLIALLGLTAAMRDQSIAVKGRLLCGNGPAANVRVKLWEEDTGKAFLIVFLNVRQLWFFLKVLSNYPKLLVD